MALVPRACLGLSRVYQLYTPHFDFHQCFWNVLGLNLDSIQEAVLLLTHNRSLHGILTQVKETSAYNSYITDNTLRITNIESDDTITPGVVHLLTSCLYNSRPVKEALVLETRLKFE